MPNLASDDYTIQVKSVADTKGADQTKTSISNLSNQTEKGSASFMKMSGAMAAGQGIYSAASQIIGKIGSEAASVVSTTEDWAKSTMKLQREMGVSSEAASGLLAVTQRFGLDTAGVSKSMGVLSKQIMAAADPAKYTGSVFDDLGVKLKNTDGTIRTADSVFMSIADRFKAMPNGVQKTAESMQLFGKSGKDLLPILNLGSSGIKELEDKAASMGLVLTSGNVASVRKLISAQKDWNESTEGLKIQLGLALMPKMTEFAQILTTKVLPVVKDVVQWITTHKLALAALGGVLGALIIGPIVAFIIAIGWIPLAIGAAVAVAAIAIGFLIAKWKEWHDWIIAIGLIIAGPLIPFIAMATLIIKYWDDIRNFGMQALDFIMAKVNWLKDNWLQALGFIIGYFVTLPIMLPGYVADAFMRIVGFVASLNWGAIFSGIGRAIGGAAEGIWQAISGAFNRIKSLPWGSIMSGVARDIGNDIINLLQGAINGALHGIPGHPHISLPHFAQGVQNFGGGLAVVGEEGPELVSLPRGSSVYPNGQGAPLPGGSNTVTIQNLYLTSADAVDRFMTKFDLDTLLVNRGLTANRGTQ